jgi:hypothetical protein
MDNPKNDDWINEMFDDIDDPIVEEMGSYGYIGFCESLIMNALITERDKNELLDQLPTMRKSKMDKLVFELKEIQNHRDPREQFKQMVARGVFKHK